MTSLLTGTRDYLNSLFSWSVAQCDVRPGGNPPPAMGQWYVSLDDAGIESDPHLDHLRETYSINIFITFRTGVQPRDRLQSIYLASSANLDAHVSAVRRALHRSYQHMLLVNTLVIPSGGDLFQLPLMYRGCAGPQVMDSSWAYGAPDSDSFLVKALRFGGALRTQAIDVMT